jgi:hypothetical protein
VGGFGSLGDKSVSLDKGSGASDSVVGTSEGEVSNSVCGGGLADMGGMGSNVSSVVGFGDLESRQIGGSSRFGLGEGGLLVSKSEVVSASSSLAHGNGTLDLGLLVHPLHVSLVRSGGIDGNSLGPVSGSVSGGEVSADLNLSHVSSTSLESHVDFVLTGERSPVLSGVKGVPEDLVFTVVLSLLFEVGVSLGGVTGGSGRAGAGRGHGVASGR